MLTKVRLTHPSPSGILEIPDQFLLFGVHAENRTTRFRKDLALLLDVPKLPFAVWMRRTTEPLDIATHGEVLPAQQSSNGVRTRGVPLIPQVVAQMPQTPTHPLAAAHRVAAAVRFGQWGQARLDRGVFFSTGGRPPPTRRTRSAGQSSSDPSISRRPRRIVATFIPVTCDRS